MRTLGIDLASRNGRTGLCELQWSDSGAAVASVAARKFTDQELVEQMRDVLDTDGWIGIDAPFGFPVAFSKAVDDWSHDGRVSVSTSPRPSWLDQKCAWDGLNRRLTDGHVHMRLAELDRQPGDTSVTWPLSSVVERITPTTIRCAELLTSISSPGEIDRVGLDSRVVEVYPVAALRLWHLPTKNYKRTDDLGTNARRQLVTELAGCRWLTLGTATAAFKASDDAIDALVCALIARLASHPAKPTDPGRTDVTETATVRAEGWIHLPPSEESIMRAAQWTFTLNRDDGRLRTPGPEGPPHDLTGRRLPGRSRTLT